MPDSCPWKNKICRTISCFIRIKIRIKKMTLFVKKQKDDKASTLSFDSKNLISQWMDQEEGALVLQSLEYLDVVTLIKKKPVCKQWQQLCSTSTDFKCHKKKKSFHSNQELINATEKYYGKNHRDYITAKWVNEPCTQIVAEEIATTYGYPINKWNVSNIKDFSSIFENKYQFNEPIGSWDVSNGTTMDGMFLDAWLFNQDLSSWDVSSVTNMQMLFCDAKSFNQDISSWDVSNVTQMDWMFYRATSFDQDISSWDVSNVTDMKMMFHSARAFNQDISAWNVSDFTDCFCMFHDSCTLFCAEDLPWFRENMLF